jgi:hypothetical protein
MKFKLSALIFTIIMSFSSYSQNEKLILTYSGGAAPAEISLQSGSTAVIDSNTGDILISTDKTAAEIAAILGINGIPPSVSITSTSSLLVTDVDTANLNWTISDATSCTKIGDWSNLGSLSPTNGSETIGPFTGPASFTYTIECTNGFDVVSNSTTVNVTDPNGISCPLEQPPILAGAEDRSIVANNGGGITYDGTWADIRNISTDTDWPGTSNNIKISLTRNQYISASFNSGIIDVNGQLQVTSPTAFEGPDSGAHSFSISECPGDFSVHLEQAKCKATGFIRWSTDPLANPVLYCKLEQNKQYYLNYVHSDNSEDDNYNTTDCVNGAALGYCGAILTNTTF